MKRKGKFKRIKRKAVTKMRKFYPLIFCPNEEKTIAISKRVKFGQVKVNKKDYIDGNAEFFTDEYVIDFNKIKDGDKVCCPKCGKPVDFRLFPSDTLPKFVRKKNED